jgi:hypothetical protein
MESASKVLIGVPDRGDHNQTTMQATLSALKAAAEGSGR